MPAGVPALVKTWTISANNRITFVSLNATMGAYLLGLKNFLKTNGYTVKGSCDGTTGAMDGVDRWATAANAQTRATTQTAPVSWLVLTDGNGCDILLSYVGNTDDVALFSYSFGGLFVAAGTPSNTPTATDSQAVSGTGSWLTSTASGDRLWFGWVDSTKKLFRTAVARGGVWVGQLFGLELFNSTMTGSAVASFTPTVWGRLIGTSTSAIPNGSQIGTTRMPVGGVAGSGQAIFFSLEWFGGSSGLFASTTQPELQGQQGWPILPLGICCGGAGFRGKLGMMFDEYQGRIDSAGGDTYGTLNWIGMSGHSGLSTGAGLWPWDGVTTPVLT